MNRWIKLGLILVIIFFTIALTISQARADENSTYINETTNETLISNFTVNESVNMTNETEMYNITYNNSAEVYNWVFSYYANQSNENIKRVYGKDNHSCLVTNYSFSLKGNPDFSIVIIAQRYGDATDYHGDLVSLGRANANSRFAVRIDNGGNFGIIGNSNGNDWTTDYQGNNNLNIYYIERNNSLTKFYINGFLIGENSHAYNIAEAPFQIGCALLPDYTPVAFFNGYIDTVLISNYSLNLSYVKSLWNGTLDGSELIHSVIASPVSTGGSSGGGGGGGSSYNSIKKLNQSIKYDSGNGFQPEMVLRNESLEIQWKSVHT